MIVKNSLIEVEQVMDILLTILVGTVNASEAFRWQKELVSNIKELGPI